MLLFLVIAGAANGVNLTDGLDGLAAGTGIIALFTFTAMNVIAWIRSGAARAPHRHEARPRDHRRRADRGAIGFLWYNALPAEVFMGDTGSMALGGALGGVRDHDEDDLPAAPDRRDLRDRGALGDHPGLLVQVLRAARRS